MTDDSNILAFPPQRPLDADYVCYIRRRLLAGLISDDAAVQALRARDPSVTAQRLAELLKGAQHGSEG